MRIILGADHAVCPLKEFEIEASLSDHTGPRFDYGTHDGETSVDYQTMGGPWRRQSRQESSSSVL